MNMIPKMTAAIVAGVLLSLNASAQETKPPQKLPFYIYSDQSDHFVPSGYMGDTSDIVIAGASKNNPGKGAACLQIKYSGKAPGEKGGEVVEFKAGGISGEYPDSFKAEASPVALTT